MCNKYEIKVWDVSGKTSGYMPYYGCETLLNAMWHMLQAKRDGYSLIVLECRQ